jgi:hypothetical protein
VDAPSPTDVHLELPLAADSDGHGRTLTAGTRQFGAHDGYR